MAGHSRRPPPEHMPPPKEREQAPERRVERQDGRSTERAPDKSLYSWLMDQWYGLPSPAPPEVAEVLALLAVAPRAAVEPPAVGPTSLEAAREGFDLLDRAAQENEWGITRWLPETVGFPEQRKVIAKGFAVLQKVRAKARTERDAAMAASASDEFAEHAELAGSLYEATLVLGQILRLWTAYLAVGQAAFAAGQPSQSVLAVIEGFEQSFVEPMIDAVTSMDRDTVTAALASHRADIEHAVDYLPQWIDALHVGADASQIAIIGLSLMTLVAGIPEAGGEGGVAAVPVLVGGGEVAALDLAAVRELVAVGALDPAFAAGMSAFAGTRGTPIPEIETPQPIEMGKADDRPKFTTKSGSGSNEVRETNWRGRDYEINSGHAYRGEHGTPGSDPSAAGTVDQIDDAIVRTIDRWLDKGNRLLPA